MERVVTQDGTVTLKSEKFGQFYHSFTGAKEESELKYVGPCEIRARAMKGRLRILDVCFGIGYNTAAAIDAALSANPDCVIEVVGLEIDETLLDVIPQLEPIWESYRLLQQLSREKMEVRDGNVSVRFVLGDAVQTVHDLEGEFDCVFFDPFSPPTNTEMWSVDVFSCVKEHLAPDGVLATYSCARMVRENLKSAGFTAIDDGPKVHRRGPGTLAKLL